MILFFIYNLLFLYSNMYVYNHSCARMYPGPENVVFKKVFYI